MDVLPIIFICISTFAAVMAQESGENSTDVDIDFTTRRPIATTPFPLNCTSAHALEGVCTARTSCDYGTPAIDRTLYKPSWYRRAKRALETRQSISGSSICAAEEVCCPFDYLLAPSKTGTGDGGAGNTLSQDDDENF